ncbi:MAG: reverse transcriptase domain-containing protein [Nitrospirales bacterium]
MSVKERFEHHFSESNLKSLHQTHIVLSAATGIDNLSQKTFWPTLDAQIKIISKKVLAGTYKFTKYKLKLISKGRGKVPREISIPTIRDRVALRALCDFLTERYKDSVKTDLPQYKVRKVKKEIESGRYGRFIKLDVSNFYPTIRHRDLSSRLRRKIRNPVIINFIEGAIKTPTVSKSLPTDKCPTRGIPQGLSVSNVLAEIFLINLDKKLLGNLKIAYFRYVDDILILCDDQSVQQISNDVIKMFRRIGLEVHDTNMGPPGKSLTGAIGDSFDYLGYQFKGKEINPRPTSVERLKESLVSIFAAYKHSKNKSEKFLLWRLNLRITGCVFQNKSKGWLFFFSEINNETLLHNLDRHVLSLVDRFKVSILPKRFVRTHYEIKHAKYQTKYIPNYDRFTLDQIKDFLITYFNTYFNSKNISSLTDEEIKYEFRKRIDRQVRDLLTDVQDFWS